MDIFQAEIFGICYFYCFLNKSKYMNRKNAFTAIAVLRKKMAIKTANSNTSVIFVAGNF